MDFENNLLFMHLCRINNFTFSEALIEFLQEIWAMGTNLEVEKRSNDYRRICLMNESLSNTYGEDVDKCK